MSAFKAFTELKSKKVEFKESEWISNASVHNGILCLTRVEESYEYDIALPRAETKLGCRVCAFFTPFQLSTGLEGQTFKVNIDIPGIYAYEFCAVTSKKVRILIARDCAIMEPMLYTVNIDKKEVRGEKLDLGQLILQHKKRSGKLAIPYFKLTQEDCYCHLSSYNNYKSWNTFLSVATGHISTQDIDMQKDPKITRGKIDFWDKAAQLKLDDLRVKITPVLFASYEPELGIVVRDGSGRERKRLSEPSAKMPNKLMSMGKDGFIVVYDTFIESYTTT